eukprot:scaffold207012_cov30-Tisochrysis_lutea.AAC.1
MPSFFPIDASCFPELASSRFRREARLARIWAAGLKRARSPFASTAPFEAAGGMLVGLEAVLDATGAGCSQVRPDTWSYAEYHCGGNGAGGAALAAETEAEGAAEWPFRLSALASCLAASSSAAARALREPILEPPSGAAAADS